MRHSHLHDEIGFIAHFGDGFNVHTDFGTSPPLWGELSKMSKLHRIAISTKRWQA